MIKNERYLTATHKAIEVLKQCNCSTLPVYLIKIIPSYEHIKLMTYTEFAKQHNTTVSEICELGNSHLGFSCYNSDEDKYIIFYNDTQGKNITRFTIAHELGHCILGHHRTNKTTNNIIEHEANCFARNLLAPPHLIKGMVIETISKKCIISLSASKVRQEYFEIDLKNIINYKFLTDFNCVMAYVKHHNLQI